MPCTGEVHILRESQHAVYRNDIARLHGLLDVKNAANQILRDAMTAQRANHAASEARIRREMAPRIQAGRIRTIPACCRPRLIPKKRR